MLVYSTSSDGMSTPVHGDRAWRDEAMARVTALGYPPEAVANALKRYRRA